MGLAALIRGKKNGMGSPREIRFRHRQKGDVTLSVSPVKAVRFQGQEGLLVMSRDVSSEKALESKLYLADRMNTLGTMQPGSPRNQQPTGLRHGKPEQASDTEIGMDPSAGRDDDHPRGGYVA